MGNCSARSRSIKMKLILMALLVVQIGPTFQFIEQKNKAILSIGTRCTCSLSFLHDSKTCSLKGQCNQRCSGVKSIIHGKYIFDIKVEAGNVTVSKCEELTTKMLQAEDRNPIGFLKAKTSTILYNFLRSLLKWGTEVGT